MQRSKRRGKWRGLDGDWHGLWWRGLEQVTLRSRWWCSMRYKGKRGLAGFTLLEILAVMVIVGVLMAIASITWLSFLNKWRLNAGQDQIYQIMRMAQSKAKNEKRRWQASFRNTQNQVQWAIHPTSVSISEPEWITMAGMVQIDPDETTLYQSGDNVYRLQFNHQGHINGRLGRLTIKGLNPHKARRCVFASTLIGTLRKARDQDHPEDGRYCY